MKSRLHYIDVFKGLLIITVVIHHAPLVCAKFCNPYLAIYWINNLILAFFMPAWFVATGFSSNFNKPFLPYLWSNFKGIMIPCFTLYCINHVLHSLNSLLFEDASWMTLSYILNPGIRTFISKGGFYWFLSALFIAKIVYWIVCKLKNHFLIFGFCLILSLGGAWSYSVGLPNPFFVQHGLMLTVFLHIGKYLKIYERYCMRKAIYISGLFLAVVILMSYFQIEIPTVTRDVTVTLFNYPIFFILSCIGTLSLWYIAKIVSQNHLLEYMGRGSLVMYAFNYVILTIMANAIILHFQPVVAYTSVFCLVSIVISSLGILTLCYWIVNHKYIKIIIGKF